MGLGISQHNNPINLTIEIFVGANGTPTGLARATHTISGAELANITAGQSMVEVEFGTPTSVEAGSSYVIVASTADPLPAAFRWYCANPYARGTAAYGDGTNWYPLDTTSRSRRMSILGRVRVRQHRKHQTPSPSNSVCLQQIPAVLPSPRA